MSALVKIYIKKIKENKITIEEVPEKWRDEVRRELQK